MVVDSADVAGSAAGCGAVAVGVGGAQMAVFGIEPAEVCEHGEDAASCLACDNEGGEG